jgi:hypothetical protein
MPEPDLHPTEASAPTEQYPTPARFQFDFETLHETHLLIEPQRSDEYILLLSGFSTYSNHSYPKEVHNLYILPVYHNE